MNRLKKKKIVLGILVGILMILIGVYLGISLFFHSHFITGTTINGADVSKMTVQQAKKAQQDHISEYILTIKERGGNTEKITADQLGITYVDDKGVEKLLKEQKAFLWRIVHMIRVLSMEFLRGFPAFKATIRHRPKMPSFSLKIMVLLSFRRIREVH